MITASYIVHDEVLNRVAMGIWLENGPKKGPPGQKRVKATWHLENAIIKCSKANGRGLISVDIHVTDEANDYLWMIANALRSFIRGVDKDILVTLL